jgi:hypothetical protein
MSETQPEHFHLKFPLADLILDGYILAIRLKEGRDITLDAIKEIYKASNDNLKGKHVAMLLDTCETNLMRFPDSVMDYAANNENSHKEIAMAILIPGFGHRIIANFFIKLNRPKTPVKIFEKEADALIWLKEQINQYQAK